MVISAKTSPLVFLYLRVWDSKDEIVPIISWLNTDTMKASRPTGQRGVEEPVSISRFEFIVTEDHQEFLLKEALPADFHNSIHLVLED